MPSNFARSPKLLARVAVVGMALAVLALGLLAVWAAIVTQNGATGLSRAGVQTSGHLRAVQALSAIDTHTDALEEKIDYGELRKLRAAQRVLDESLSRMRDGSVVNADRIADAATPIVRRLKPQIELFLANPPGMDSDGTAGAEEGMERTMEELQVLLNDLSNDPSRDLGARLDSVKASEATVRHAAFVLLPLGLGGVAACAWIIRLYRRRSEGTMQDALSLTATEARTDQLTGLHNRRALVEELDQRTARGESFMLALADLNGFKGYNDSFGHAAGDALLRRLGGKLTKGCGEHGIAARLGGDEFCVLLFGHRSAREVGALVESMLSEEGEGFRISASCGIASVPDEADSSSSALRVADERMYAAKFRSRPSVEHDMSVALTQMLDESHPGMGSHVEAVALLAVGCAEALGLSGEEVRSVERTAELHDLGKVGIPSSILTKPKPLDDDEWELMRTHSMIGERILTGVPSMKRVATAVRGSHERWDGGGYPDGIAGEAIPIASRIVAAADSFCAMTEARPYAQARTVESAIGELRRCSGTQFDPAVVVAFVQQLEAREAHLDLMPAPA
jgi:diguanylate cyclase (GGDEF)-like protein